MRMNRGFQASTLRTPKHTSTFKRDASDNASVENCFGERAYVATDQEHADNGVHNGTPWFIRLVVYSNTLEKSTSDHG